MINLKDNTYRALSVAALLGGTLCFGPSPDANAQTLSGPIPEFYEIPRFIDATGDGLADILYQTDTTVFIFPSAADVCPQGFILNFRYGCRAEWGVAGDLSIDGGADFSGDGLADAVKIRSILHPDIFPLTNSECPQWAEPHGSGCWRPWGLEGDVFEYLDADGDGTDDPMQFRPSEGKWYGLMSSGVCPSGWEPHLDGCVVQWGLPGDEPIGGFDLDSDGREDPTVRRGEFFYSRASSGTCPQYWSPHAEGCEIHWGLENDAVVVGDWYGDGKNRLSVISAGTSTIRPIGLTSLSTGGASHGTGQNLFAADLDGDGRTDMGYLGYSGHGEQRRLSLISFYPTSRKCPAAYPARFQGSSLSRCLLYVDTSTRLGQRPVDSTTPIDTALLGAFLDLLASPSDSNRNEGSDQGEK